LPKEESNVRKWLDYAKTCHVAFLASAANCAVQNGRSTGNERHWSSKYLNVNQRSNKTQNGNILNVILFKYKKKIVKK